MSVKSTFILFFKINKTLSSLINQLSTNIYIYINIVSAKRQTANTLCTQSIMGLWEVLQLSKEVFYCLSNNCGFQFKSTPYTTMNQKDLSICTRTHSSDVPRCSGYIHTQADAAQLSVWTVSGPERAQGWDSQLGNFRGEHKQHRVHMSPKHTLEKTTTTHPQIPLADVTAKSWGDGNMDLLWMRLLYKH